MTIVENTLDSLEKVLQVVSKKNKLNILYNLNKKDNSFWIRVWPYKCKMEDHNIRIFAKKCNKGWLLTDLAEYAEDLYNEFGDDLEDYMNVVDLPNWMSIYDNNCFYCFTTDTNLLEHILIFYYALLELKQLLYNIEEDIAADEEQE